MDVRMYGPLQIDYSHSTTFLMLHMLMMTKTELIGRVSMKLNDRTEACC